jgi:hypothetical protein
MSTKSIVLPINIFQFRTRSLLKSLFMVFGWLQRLFRGLDWIKSTVHLAIFKVLYIGDIKSRRFLPLHRAYCYTNFIKNQLMHLFQNTLSHSH